MGNQSERGARSLRVFQNALAEEHAEEARLLYVAATRARDRLIISGPTVKPHGYAQWLERGLDGAIEAHEAAVLRDVGASDDAATRDRRSEPASDDDSATGTGRQLDAFGFDHAPEDDRGQFNLFAPRHDPETESEGDAVPSQADGVEVPLVLFRTPSPIQETLRPAPVELWWLDGLRERPAPVITLPIARVRHGFTTSATELRMRELDPETWKLRYAHGVVPAAEFARAPDSGAGLPARIRGTLIHTVLERLEAESELARILGEAIAGLDAPESETLLEPGSAYREALREEIEAVVRSDEWAHYVDGRHWRELPFLHLLRPREWRLGAYDLFRPGGVGEASEVPRIVDFKTHVIDASDVAATAATYEIQAAVYREAAEAILGRPVQVSLHFTHPNVAIDV